MSQENLTIEERCTQLLKAKERPQTPRPKIQRVAHYLRTRKHFAKHYSPKLVSIGPIHHGDESLQLGEQYKRMWAAKYVESTGQAPQTLHKRIADNIKGVKDLFTKDAVGGFDDPEELSWMLFVDGCSLLHILEYAKLDPQNNMNVKVDQLVLVMQDVLLLENQLPYQVLKLLWRGDEASLIKTMKNFLRCHHWPADSSDNADQKWKGKRKQKHQDPTSTEEDLERQESTVALPDESTTHLLDLQPESPTHLLDLQRSIILRDPHNKVAKEDQEINQNQHDMITYKNIQELKASGIRLKTTKSRRPSDISFSGGWLTAELKLPEIVVDDTTAPTLLNMIAYEMCPDFENNYGICSFVAFLDSLIDNIDDVKTLRSEGILLNSLGSDDEVAHLFNTISTDLVPDTGRYFRIRAKIDEHYRKKWKTWIALGYHTYFSNPWAIIAFLAAVLALALTFIQTWFAVHPVKS